MYNLYNCALAVHNIYIHEGIQSYQDRGRSQMMLNQVGTNGKLLSVSGVTVQILSMLCTQSSIHHRICVIRLNVKEIPRLSGTLKPWAC
jgi:ABC-type Fe2+-enterobactin transport system substrate-binding protein